MPRIEPNRTLTPALPLAVLRDVVYSERKSTPRPKTQANTLPMTTSSALPRRPRPDIAMPTAMVVTKRPSRASAPKASAASAPVTATWLRASPVKTWLRNTMK